MTPTPEADERARALREAVAERLKYEDCRCETRRGMSYNSAMYLRAIVTELGITQEMVTEINAAWPMDPDSSLLGDAADALSVLLAAGGGGADDA